MVRWEAGNDLRRDGIAGAAGSPGPMPIGVDSPSFDSLLSAAGGGGRVSSKAKSADRAQTPRDARADVALAMSPDPSLLAATELSERGQIRATVQAAVTKGSSAGVPGAVAEAATDEQVDTPDSPEQSQSGDAPLARSSGSHRAATDASPTSSGGPSAQSSTSRGQVETPALGDGSAQQSSNAGGVLHTIGDRAAPVGASSAPAAAPILPVAAAIAVRAVSVQPAPAAAPPGMGNAIGGVSGASPGERGSSRSAQYHVRQGELAQRQPENSAETAPGVRGQAMRGMFAALRGGAAGRDGGGTVSMRLLPESLGEMKVSMKVREGRVRAMFVVSSEEAQGSLRDAMPELRDRLEARGLVIESLHVRLAGRSGSEDPGSAPGTPDQDFSGLAGDSRSDRGSGDGRESHHDAAGRRGGAGTDGEGGGPQRWVLVSEQTGEDVHNTLSTGSRRLRLDLTA